MNNKIETLQQALCLNNNGVAYLAQGDAASALRSLARSLTIINEFVARSEAGLETGNPIGVPCPMMPYRLPMFPQSELFYVHNQAMVLRSPDDPQWLQDCDVCSTTAVVLFNMALAFHCDAMSGNEARLRKASFMYEECTKLLEEGNDFALVHLNVLLLAAANNQAALYYQLQDYEQTVNYLKAARDAYVPIATAIDGEKFVDEILLNFTTLSMRPTVAASA